MPNGDIICSFCACDIDFLAGLPLGAARKAGLRIGLETFLRLEEAAEAGAGAERLVECVGMVTAILVACEGNQVLSLSRSKNRLDR